MLYINGDASSPNSEGMRRNEGASAEALRHVRDLIGEYLRPVWQIYMSDELDRYEYEWVEAGECYKETDGNVTYTVPVLRSVSYGRDEDVQAAAKALGFDRYCDECEHVVDWLGRQYDALTQRLRITSEDVACAKGAVRSDVIACGCASGGSAKDGAIYVGVFDDDCAQVDASCASGGLEPTAECAHAMPPADEGSGTPWFPDRWTPEGYYEMCDEGVGIQAFIQEYGQDFVSHDLGLPGFLGDALVATSELGGAR